MQQYVVDSHVKVEGNRLNFIRHIQRTLRVELYLGLSDHINALATEAGVMPGVPLILPSSFNGSPREMQQNFQDAMSIVRDFGKPDLFLTFTCNPKWNEIKENLFPGQNPHDRPDFIARVFDMKKKARFGEKCYFGSYSCRHSCHRITEERIATHASIADISR
ncbi:hypothetical protein AVEN_111323-1 [Araneus ventricosus]|uniref:Helitron helicase-like domain-containing protein n=1 Tax=Araneus ventricosus TaxID=182803 RepID=A0A4Y2GLK6_ARAVE|nr:hypothetical protein AVEN_111323-1 [Araneus ventricosus]